MSGVLFRIFRSPRVRRYLRGPVRGILDIVLFLSPKRPHVVVFGCPDREGNGVEVIRRLGSSYPGEIIWLREFPELDISWVFDAEPPPRLRVVGRSSLRALRAFVTAEAVFFTHGIFDGPLPGRRQTFVNLWHGDGPKRMGNPSTCSSRPLMPSSLLVSGTELWGAEKARSLGVPQTRVVVSGNPRIDQFLRPAATEELELLGLNPQLPVVAWLPTFRRASGGSSANWDDGDPMTQNQDTRAFLRDVAEVARQMEVQVLVKPHPLDTDRYVNVGLRTIGDEDLDRHRVMLYRLLAACAGLVTDYSSVWSDYLALNRPIGLYCPDLSDYVATRGLTVDYQSVAPGPFLATVDDFSRFFEIVAGRRADDGVNSRRSSVDAIGASTAFGATVRLLEYVDEFRSANGLRPLRPPNESRLLAGQLRSSDR